MLEFGTSCCKRVKKYGTSGFLTCTTYNFNFTISLETLYTASANLAWPQRISSPCTIIYLICSIFWVFFVQKLFNRVPFFILLNKMDFNTLALCGTVYRREQRVAVWSDWFITSWPKNFIILWLWCYHEPFSPTSPNLTSKKDSWFVS